jgi:DnaJ like chaperone protein
LQLRKYGSFKSLMSSALRPLPGVGGLIYRLESWSDAPPRPAPVIEKITPRDIDFKHISFTFAVIALSARVARIDGALTGARYIAFREAFPLTGGICGKIRGLFLVACENPTPFEHYVNSIKYAFPRRMPLFTSLVDRLFRIAAADGDVSREAERMLSKVAHMLELSPADYMQIRERHRGPRKAHEVLGVKKRIKASALKKHYRELMRRWHPDHFASQDLSPEVELLLRLKASEINEAYRALSKKAA